MITSPEEVLIPLAWDSEHFGFPVSQISSPALDDSSLYKVLRFARHNGVQLVYWATSHERHVSPCLLSEFSGILVDQKASFLLDLSQIILANRNVKSSAFHVLEYPSAPSTNRLLSLAVTAGNLSRFSVDPYIPKEKFISLYHTWMNRSTLRELADVVLVAAIAETKDDLIGMITASKADTMGNIGLIGVSDSFQGKGVGSLLMHAVHSWMIGRSIKQAAVITQLANTPACKLYKQWGYRLIRIQPYYHFWPRVQKD